MRDCISRALTLLAQSEPDDSAKRVISPIHCADMTSKSGSLRFRKTNPSQMSAANFTIFSSSELEVARLRHSYNRASHAPLPVRIHHSDLVHSTACQVQPSIGSGDHVANHTATGWDRLRTEAPRFGIEPDQCVRVHARFAVPDLAIVRDRDPIRL